MVSFSPEAKAEERVTDPPEYDPDPDRVYCTFSVSSVSTPDDDVFTTWISEL